MKITIVKCIFVYLWVSAAGCLCFQSHLPVVSEKLMFAEEVEKTSPSPTQKLDSDDEPICNKTNGKYNLFNVDWSFVSSKISNNWWIIVMSMLLPFVMFWRIKYNMRKRLLDWRKMFIQKQKASLHCRRPTLPDLTLAKHARRESLAEGMLKLTIRRKPSQSNITQFWSTRKNSFERNEDSSTEIKRAHLIRRH